MTPGKGFTITREVEPWWRWLHSGTHRAHTHEGHRSISHYLPLTRAPHASSICMTISPSAMAECKRILAIHIYRSALLPALVTALVQFVRFQHRPLPSTFCSTSTYGHTRAHVHTSLSLSPLLSLFPFSPLNSSAISRIYLSGFCVSVSSLFRRLFAVTSNSHCRLRRSRRCRRQSAVERWWKGKREAEV